MMNLDNTVVIELGTPQDLDTTGLAPLVEQVCRRVMSGQKVIAVVSPPMWRGEQDFAASERLGQAADGHARAMLLGSGAIDVAQRFAGLLADRGIRVARVDAAKTAPTTRGHALDAQPRHVNARHFNALFAKSDVVVVPAGVGLDDLGRATHLGEPGGPLTALFLGDAFGLPVVLCERLDGHSLGVRKARLFARDRSVRYRVEVSEESTIPSLVNGLHEVRYRAADMHVVSRGESRLAVSA